MNALVQERMVGLGRRLVEAAAQVRRGYLQMFGIPDYERYLAHLATHHPGQEPLTRKEFAARAIERKYCRSGPRCC
jgi:uncharacterized short protein YbdD (DUF466 family)